MMTDDRLKELALTSAENAVVAELVEEIQRQRAEIRRLKDAAPQAGTPKKPATLNSLRWGVSKYSGQR